MARKFIGVPDENWEALERLWRLHASDIEDSRKGMTPELVKGIEDVAKVKKAAADEEAIESARQAALERLEWG